MKISVVVTVYNLQAYVTEAINSILSQTQAADEIIVIDDCSTDDSAARILAFGDRVKYIRMPENSGVLLATLRGIRAASGDIISFLDGDDLWLPSKVEKVMREFKSHPDVIMLSHNYEIIDAQGIKTGVQVETHKNLERIVSGNPDLELMSARIKDSIVAHKGFWLGSAYCFRREAFDIDKFEEFLDSIPFPNLKRLCYQDHPIAQFIVLNNTEKFFYFINEVLFQYRIFGFNSSGVSNTLESALRTVRKAQASTLTTLTLVRSHPGLEVAARRQSFMMQELDFLQHLYTRKYLQSFWILLQLNARPWSGANRLKELKRFAGVLILGPEKFLALKSKKVAP